METDLDLADKLQAIDQELSGDGLMLAKYASQVTTNVQKSYNNILYASSTNDFKTKTMIDSVLHRPTTPGQLRQSIAAYTVDSLANSLVVGDIFQSHSNGFEQLQDNNTILAASTSIIRKKSLSTSVNSIATNNSIKFSKTLSSTTRPKSTNRMSSTEKQVTPVLAFDTNDDLDRSTPPIIAQKITPPMKYSVSEPPRSNSSASIRSSSSSILELSNGNINHQKPKKS
jgi:hypothetical protein